MIHLFTLTPDWKAVHVSAHFNLIKAQEAANALNRNQRANGKEKTPVIFAQCRNVPIGGKVKDMKGRTFDVVSPE